MAFVPVLVAQAGQPVPGYRDGDTYRSIHARQLEQHRHDPVGVHTRAVAPKRQRALTHTVYGWYPYWMGSAYLDLDWSLLTHVSFFSLEADQDGSITSAHGWPSSWTGLVSSAQGAGVTVTLTCTLFGTTPINTLIDSPTYRATLISNLVSACQAGGATGVNIDFEGSSLHKANLVTFMNELRAGLDAEIPGAHLSMATPAVDWSGCFDYDMLAAACDVLIAMCYDYHWKGGSPGPVSPLTAGSVWSQYTVEWTVADYVYYGTPPDKLAVGVPYYGYDWLVSGDPSNYPAADGAGDATARIYSYITSTHAGYAKQWDPHSQTPWYYYWYDSDPRQVWYDDDVSLGLKYDLVLTEGLAGIGIWALGYDGPQPELWDEIESHFWVEPTPTPTATPLPQIDTLMVYKDDADDDGVDDARLVWDPLGGVSLYEVFYATSPGGSSQLLVQTSGPPVFHLDALTAGVDYYYQVEPLPSRLAAENMPGIGVAAIALGLVLLGHLARISTRR